MEQASISDVDGRARLVVSVGMSVDARVTLGRDRLLLDEDTARIWRSLSPPSAEELGEAREAELARLYRPRAVLEGSGTFVTDDVGPLPGLGIEVDEPDLLYTDFLPEEVLERPDHDKWFTVVDGRGRVAWDMKGGSGGWDLLVLVARATPADYLAYLRKERISYLVVGEQRVDLATALHRMRERLGVTCVVSKAGGGLNGALLREGLVDEIHLLIMPAAIGGLGTPTLFDGPELPHGEVPTRLRLVSVRTETDGMVWLRYEVVRDGPRPLLP